MFLFLLFTERYLLIVFQLFVFPERNFPIMFLSEKIFKSLKHCLLIGPAFSTRGNLARARARGGGPPRTVEHRYLPDLGCYRTLVMRAMY